MVIVRVKDLDDVSCQIFLLDRFLIIALVKRIQMEAFHRLCIPDTECIHNAVSVSYDRHIIGNRLNRLIPLLHKMLPAVLVCLYIYIAAEFHDLGVLRAAQLKRVAVRKPVVRHFHLISVTDLLLEHTVAVADAASVCRISECGKGIQEAGCQSAQSTIAQCRIRLLILDHIQIDTQLLERFPDLLISLQIYHVIAKRTAHQKLHGHIVYDLDISFFIFFLGIHPVIDDGIFYSIRDSLKDLLGRRLLQCFAVKCLDIIEDTPLKELFVK